MSLQWFLLGGKRKLFLIFTQKALKCHPKFLSLKNEWGPKHFYELLFTVVGAGRLNNKESVSNMSSHPLKSGRLTRACDELPLAKRMHFSARQFYHTHIHRHALVFLTLLPSPSAGGLSGSVLFSSSSSAPLLCLSLELPACQSPATLHISHRAV